jgi:diaminobutyrate-2-oxoglutarate transaminase
VGRNADGVQARLLRLARRHDLEVRGRGLMQGIVMPSGQHASAVTRQALERGLIVETSGPDDEVVKIFCPLTIEERDLEQGLEVLEQGIATTMERRLRRVS